MTQYGSKALLFTNIANNLIKSGVAKFVSALKHRTSQEDIFDTIIPEIATVADYPTLTASVLGTGHKENDIRIVTKDNDGKKAVYQYVKLSGTYDWQKTSFMNDNKRVLSAQSTLALYISAEWADKDLALWDIVKVGTKLYLLYKNNGSSTGDYEQINLVFEALSYQGTWNANTNTPTLVSSTGTKGHYYVVSADGSTNIDGITDWKIGDWIVFNGTVWEKVDNTDAVTSVNGHIGTVVLDIDDVTPTTTKGDLIVENGSNAVRLALGSDGQELEADSTESSGLKWVGKKEVIQFAVSDEDTDLTTGTAKITFRMPFAMTLSEVRASVVAAPTGANIVIDINESGTTVLSTKLSIDAGEKTSTTAVTPPVISDSALADDSEITVDIDTIGITIAGAGLKITLIGRRA